MPTVTKKNLIDRLVVSSKLKRGVVKDLIQAFLDEIMHELRHGNRIEFRDFGVFEVKERAERIAQNPKTLKRVRVPAKRAVKFKMGRQMRDSFQAGPPRSVVEPKPAVDGQAARQPTAASAAEPRAADRAAR
jgi:integration host factor subunit beta